MVRVSLIYKIDIWSQRFLQDHSLTFDNFGICLASHSAKVWHKVFLPLKQGIGHRANEDGPPEAQEMSVLAMWHER